MNQAPTQRGSFRCVITDTQFNETYSAEVSAAKKGQVRTSLQPGRIDLADFYVRPLTYPKRIHNHFVLYESGGQGLYIVRDDKGVEVRRTECSIWDLGAPFALAVRRLLKEFT